MNPTISTTSQSQSQIQVGTAYAGGPPMHGVAQKETGTETGGARSPTDTARRARGKAGRGRTSQPRRVGSAGGAEALTPHAATKHTPAHAAKQHTQEHGCGNIGPARAAGSDSPPPTRPGALAVRLCCAAARGTSCAWHAHDVGANVGAQRTGAWGALAQRQRCRRSR